MVTPHKLSLRVMRMQMVWWCVGWRMEKVMFLTLGMMPRGVVVIWRNIKHLTSAWRGGGKNTHG